MLLNISQYRIEFYPQLVNLPFLCRCGHCEDLFDESKDLLKHSESFHQKPNNKPKQPNGTKGLKMYPGICDLCGKSSKGIEHHMHWVHGPGKKVSRPCVVCGKVFKMGNEMNAHHQTVHEKRTCHVCGKDISIKKHHYHMLQAHTKPEDRPHKCTTCGKGFIYPDKLEEHYNVHTGAKPFKCKYCPAAYGSNGTKAMHEKGHLGIKRKPKQKIIK